ncbi:MAG: radical SAM protein [Candidatus Hodarchaeota archaeon]
MQLGKEESPEHVQTSTAGAIALGLQDGSFYRGASLHCLNLLLTYADGCKANCAFCGLGRGRKHSGLNQGKTFIRVDWPVFETRKIVKLLKSSSSDVIKRVCISMVTHKNAPSDTITMVNHLLETDKLISVLVAPTIIDRQFLQELRDAGVDKVGVAMDAATPELFEKFRGKAVKGPHSWSTYWNIFKESMEILGPGNTGVHMIVGLGETEKQMIDKMQEIHNLGSDTHLFSFFPEAGSLLEKNPQPGIGTYRRIQLAREAMHLGLTTAGQMKFNEKEQVVDFNLTTAQFDELISDGRAFQTQGCTDNEGIMVCNRPYSNCTPFQASKGELRNFPFKPASDDLALIRRQLGDYNPDSWIRTLEKADDFLLDEQANII